VDTPLFNNCFLGIFRVYEKQSSPSRIFCSLLKPKDKCWLFKWFLDLQKPPSSILFTLNSLDRHERQNLYLVFLQLYGPLSVNSHKCYRLIYRRQDLKSPCGENQAFNVVLCLSGVFNMTNHIQIHKYVLLKVPVKSKLSMCSELSHHRKMCN